MIGKIGINDCQNTDLKSIIKTNHTGEVRSDPPVEKSLSLTEITSMKFYNFFRVIGAQAPQGPKLLSHETPHPWAQNYCISKLQVFRKIANIF